MSAENLNPGNAAPAWKECRPTEIPNREFTGERIVSGRVGEDTFREHEARYVFAGKFVKSKEVLDVACGTGIGTNYLLKVGASKCVGIDIDKDAIEYAKASYHDCAFAQCDATSLSLPDGSIDVVVSFETIEHLRDQMKFLMECNRVLRPNGILICSTPNRTMHRWQANNPFHTRELTATEFTDLIRRVFSDVQLHSQNNKNYLLHVARTLILRLLVQLKLKNTVKRFVGWESAPIASRTDFDPTLADFSYEVRPYNDTVLIHPMYMIAVARCPSVVHTAEYPDRQK